jgi:S1-C subfamily serine protease
VGGLTVAQCEDDGAREIAVPDGGAPAEMDPTWKETITRVSPAIVSIIVNVNRDFDHEKAGSSQATGFVVDAKRGIILTNKHVVHSGPVSARAILNNHEEVQLTPICKPACLASPAPAVYHSPCATLIPSGRVDDRVGSQCSCPLSTV